MPPGPQGRYHVAQVHLRHLNLFPNDLGDILSRYDKVLVPEMNLGQLSLLLRAKYLVDAVGYNQVRGLPLKAAELARLDRRACRPGRGPRSTSPPPRPSRPHGEVKQEHHVDQHRAGSQACVPGGAGPDDRRAADRQGLHHRPGGPLVPGLR